MKQGESCKESAMLNVGLRRWSTLGAFLFALVLPAAAHGDGEAPSRVEVGGFQVRGEGPRVETVKTTVVQTLGKVVASCADQEISLNSKYPRSFKCYAEISLGKDGKLEATSLGGICSAFSDCAEARIVGLDVKSKGAAVERYSVFMVILNNIPAKSPTRPGPSQPAKPAEDVSAKEDRGILQDVGHAYMDAARDQDRRKQKEQDDRRRNASNAASETILAPAPMGMARHKLGRPVNAKFEEISGPDGKSLFGPDLPPRFKQNVTKVETRFSESEDDFRAHARGWGLSAGYDSQKHSMFFVHRATQILECEEVDDTNPVRKAPPGAKYFIKRIYYGRSFELYSQIDQQKHDALQKAKVLTFSGDVGKFESTYDMKLSTSSRGLTPQVQTLFNGGREDFQKLYKNDADAGEPVPILVEYGTSPG